MRIREVKMSSIISTKPDMIIKMPNPIPHANVMSNKALAEMANKYAENALSSMGLPKDMFTPKALPIAVASAQKERIITKNNLFNAGKFAFLGVSAAILAKYIYNTCKTTNKPVE